MESEADEDEVDQQEVNQQSTNQRKVEQNALDLGNHPSNGQDSQKHFNQGSSPSLPVRWPVQPGSTRHELHYPNDFFPPDQSAIT